MRLRAFGRLFVACALAVVAPLTASQLAHALPPPPPGGHHPLSFGGDNQAPYPAITRTDVPEAADPQARFSVKVVPNPFLGTTTVRFPLLQGQVSRLRVYDLAGRLVRDLVQPATASGWQTIVWDGRDDQGRLAPVGAYLYRVEAGARVASGKLVMLR